MSILHAEHGWHDPVFENVKDEVNDEQDIDGPFDALLQLVQRFFVQPGNSRNHAWIILMEVTSWNPCLQAWMPRIQWVT